MHLVFMVPQRNSKANLRSSMTPLDSPKTLVRVHVTKAFALEIHFMKLPVNESKQSCWLVCSLTDKLINLQMNVFVAEKD